MIESIKYYLKKLKISPWIKTKSQFFFSLILDLTIIGFIIFNSSNYFIKNNNLNIYFLTSIISVFYSYIYGRFSILDNPLYKNKELKLIKNSIITFVLTLISLFFIKRFENILDLEIFNYSNINQFLIEISIAQLLGQVIMVSIYKYNLKHQRKKSILLIDEENKFRNILFLQHEKAKIERINFINSLDRRSLSEEENYSEVLILDKFLKENSEHIIKEMASKDVSISNAIKWFEFNFNRIPCEILNVFKYPESRSIPTGKTFDKRLKRLGDISFSLFLIIITSPIVLILIFLIKLEDGGPIFYSQIRSGFKYKPFKLWKFRSMKENSEKSGPQWAKSNDKRVTKIGFIMRKTRLDELPQLINVLQGDMSLIGPRPERPEIDTQLSEEINLYSERYTIRPGLSGWAQVNYPYGASIEDAKNKLSFDLFYIKYYSFWLDIIIAFKTIKIVLNAKGAYPK